MWACKLEGVTRGKLQQGVSLTMRNYSRLDFDIASETGQAGCGS